MIQSMIEFGEKTMHDSVQIKYIKCKARTINNVPVNQVHHNTGNP